MKRRREPPLEHVQVRGGLEDEVPQVAMSAKMKHWMAGAEKGCKTSKAALGVVSKELNTECMQTASKQIAALEAHAAKGCKKSAAKLHSIEVALAASAKPTKKEKKAGFAKFRKAGQGCDGCSESECAEKCGDAKKATTTKRSVSLRPCLPSYPPSTSSPPL